MVPGKWGLVVLIHVDWVGCCTPTAMVVAYNETLMFHYSTFNLCIWCRREILIVVSSSSVYLVDWFQNYISVLFLTLKGSFVCSKVHSSTHPYCIKEVILTKGSRVQQIDNEIRTEWKNNTNWKVFWTNRRKLQDIEDVLMLTIGALQVRSRHHTLICPHLSSSLWRTKRVPIKKGAKNASSKIGLLADTCTTTRLICMRFSSMDKMCLKCKAAKCKLGHLLSSTIVRI